MTDVPQVVDPRREAQERVSGRFGVRVLEPSPPAVTEPPWFADDPVNDERAGSGLPVIAPVPVPDAGLTWNELVRAEPDLASWCADRWLGAWRPLVSPSDLDALVRTRRAWHTLAEHVLAPARYQSNGKIGLRFTRAGFGTPFFGADEQVRVAVDGLLAIRDGVITADPVTTIAAAARVTREEPGAPSEVYTPTTPFEPDALLSIDVACARFLGDWFGFGASVLEEMRAAVPAADAPGRVQLWPEHFDLSFDFGDEQAGRHATYGASPGDEAHAMPYVYVLPWERQTDTFWNEGTFASLSFDELAEAPDQRRTALDFFARARARLATDRP